MDTDSDQPGSPAGGPLQAIPQDRVNQQRDSSSSVHDKISQFNSMSIAMQSRTLERKTADAALKRAMLGREEAEMELRKYKEEVKSLRKAVEEGKERERRVGERLETVMESYGRAKETHAHTQTLWEKEIRRARKETFKTQSTNVKLQEELKSARTAVKILEESIEREKERSRVREQEAFTARYQIVGVQEQLEQALAQIKVVEQERDAFKTAAKNEEVARIAAEGRIPLPATKDPNDEFASPPKKGTKKRKISKEMPRVSLSTWEVESSAATEMEIEELTMQVQWEKQRADRAQEMIEFLQAECQMQCCPCGRTKSRASPGSSQRKARESSVKISEPVKPAKESTAKRISGEESKVPEENPEDAAEVPRTDSMNEAPEELAEPEESVLHHDIEIQDISNVPVQVEKLRPSPEAEAELAPPISKKGPRRSTIFCPREGIFRTVSEQEAAAMQKQKEAEVVVENIVDEDSTEPPAHVEEVVEEVDAEMVASSNPRMYARTPSVDPPTFAQRTSLLSLLNAPHNDTHHTARIPMVSDDADEDNDYESRHNANHGVKEELEDEDDGFPPRESPEPRPHTSATLYTTVTTTIPVRNEEEQRESSVSFNEKLRTPSAASSASFDTTNPALTPTMTREQALAKIRERRGRARSAANGTMTPHKKMLEGKDRRDMSAPTSKAGSKSRP